MPEKTRELKTWESFSKEDIYRTFIASGIPQDDKNYFESGFNDVRRTIVNDSVFFEKMTDEHKTIYELGCGDGRMTMALAKIFKRVYAVDIVQKFLENAKASFKKYGVKNVTLKQFRFDDINEFKADLFYSYIVLQHNSLDSIERTLSAVNLSLKKNAKFKVQVRGQEIAQNSPFWGHAFSSEEEIKEIFKRSGFEVEKIEGLGVRYCWVWGKKC